MGMRCGSLWVACCCLLVCGTARAQKPAPQQNVPTEQGLEARLRGPAFLMLRGMYSGDRLKFDAQGRLKMLAGVMPLSLSAVRVEKVRLEGGSLEMEGTREGLEFGPPEQPGQPLAVTAVPWGGGERVEITVQVDRRHREELGAAFDAVFTGVDDALADAAPDYWQPWLRHYAHFSDAADRLRTFAAQDPAAPCRGGEGLTPPQLVSDEPPEFSDAARMAHFGGIAVLHLTVNAAGRPERIFVWRPLGMGLDEQAVAAVRQYVFTPALRDGKPVACQTNVEVSFRMR